MLRLDKSLLKEVLFGIFLFNFLFYFSSFIVELCDLNLHNVVSKLDFFFPTLTVFIVPYFIFIIFFFVAPYFMGVKDRLLLHRFITTLIISATIGSLFFLIYPTYVNRAVFNVKNGILIFIHNHDIANNACPSFHVLGVWCIWIHFKKLPLSNVLLNLCRVLSYIIIVSTVFIRQHALIDILVAIAIVEVVYFFVKKYSLDSKLFNFVETKYFKYIKKMFFSILIVLSVFLAICFSFVAHYYIKGLTFRENIKEVYVSNLSKQEKPKVSIVIPIYNHEKYLRECLDSVVNQTMNDIEIICVNDGSTDGSFAILKEYANNDNRIKIIDKGNTGLGPSRNVGLDYISGEYVMFLDSDDMLRNNACEIAYEKIKESNSDILSFGWNVFTDTNNPVYKKISKDYKLVDKDISFSNKDWEKALNTDHPYSVNKIYKTNFIKNYRFLRNKFFAEEIDMSYKLFKNCSKITLIDDVLYKVRISGQNLSLKRDLKTLLLAWKSFAVCIFDLSFNCKFKFSQIIKFFHHHLQKYNGVIYH